MKKTTVQTRPKQNKKAITNFHFHPFFSLSLSLPLHGGPTSSSNHRNPESTRRLIGARSVPTRLEDTQLALSRGLESPPPLHLVTLPQIPSPRDRAPAHALQDHHQQLGPSPPSPPVRIDRRREIAQKHIVRRSRGRVRRSLPHRCGIR